MKHPIGICTWSLRNDLSEITRTMEETGLRHLHLEGSVAGEFRPAIEQNGWSVSSMMVGFPQEDYSTLESIRKTGGIMPDDCWDSNRELVMNAIELTAQMGVPCFSTHMGFIDHNDAEGYATFCGRATELADCAAMQGVALLMETGQETAHDLRQCLEFLNHPALGVNFDPANMILYGKGDPIAAVHTLAPWIKHVHIKDAIASPITGEWGQEVPWGDGEVGMEAFMQALKVIGYAGVCAIEREAGDSRIEDIQTAASRLEKLS